MRSDISIGFMIERVRLLGRRYLRNGQLRHARKGRRTKVADSEFERQNDQYRRYYPAAPDDIPLALRLRYRRIQDDTEKDTHCPSLP